MNANLLKQRVHRRSILAVAVLMACTSARALPVLWIGPSGGDWGAPGNWNLGVPGAADDALLTAFNTTVSAGTFSVQSFTGTGTLTVTGGSLSSSAASSVGSFSFSGGTLTGTGAVNINGGGGWTGGTMSGTGTTTFNNALSLSGGSSNTRLISGRTVNFAGTTTWSNGGTSLGSIATANGATLNNTGVWLDQIVNGQAITTTGTASTFNNSGSYTKTGSTYTDIQTRFNNTGTLTVSNNVLYLSGGGSLTNRLDAAGGAVLQLNSGTFSLTGLVASSGSGLLNVATIVNATGSNSFGGSLGVSAGTLDVSGTFDANGFNVSGGTLTGTGAVNINGGGGWTGGTMSGTGTTTFNNALSLSGGSSNTRLISGRTVNFAGTTTWSNGGTSLGSIATANGATLNNTGVWLDQISNGQAITSSGTPSTFNNSGTYIKSGATTTDLSAIRLFNTGTIDVQTSVINLPANFANAGKLMGRGTLATNILTNNGRVAPGESTGTLTIAGSFVQSGTGSLDIELQDPLNRDQLKVTGSATVGGTLNLICFANCSFAIGQSITILDAAPNALTGTFASVVVSGFSINDFTVTYDRANGDVLLNAVAVPEPDTWALFLGGGSLIFLLRGRRLGKSARC